MTRSAPGAARGGRRWLILAVVCTAAVVNAVDNLILNAALPTMAIDLGASTSQLQWIVDAYVLVYAGLLLVGGSLADRFGRARMQLIGLSIFGAASLCGALSSTTLALVLCRGAMGAAAALIMPASMAMLAHEFESASERRRAFGVWASASGLGLALGPVVGGVLLSRFWWGSVFLVNVPIVAVALVAGWLFLPESRDPRAARMDGVGIVLSVAGVLGLVWATIEAPVRGWLSAETGSLFAVAIALLVGFVAWELRCAHPMLRLTLFRERGFTVSVLCAVSVQFSYAGTMFCLTQLLQSVQGYSPLGAGMRIVPYAASFAIGGMCSPRLTERLAPRGAIALGSGIFAAGLLMLTFVGAERDATVMVAATVAMGIGGGFTVSAILAAAMGSAPSSQVGAAAGAISTVRQVSVALGVAVIGSLLVSGYRARMSPALDGLTLSPADRELSLGSVESALRVSRRLTDGAPLAEAARDGFVQGMHIGSFVAAGALLASAALAMGALRADARVPVTSARAAAAE